MRPEQVFVGNGSDEVLAHAFVALLKQPKPLLFPDVTYSFYPVWAQLFGLACETVPLDGEMRVRVEDYRREAGSIVIANPNAPTGIALPRAEIARLLEDHPDIPVVIDEAYVDFGGESAVPLIANHPNLLVVQTMSKSRALAGLRVGYALGDVGLIEALRRVKDSFNSYPLGRIAQAGATASVRYDAYFRQSCAKVIAGLFAFNPFPNGPTRQVRTILYQYWFTDLRTKRVNGNWWRREELGEYAPALEREPDGKIAILDWPTHDEGQQP